MHTISSSYPHFETIDYLIWNCKKVYTIVIALNNKIKNILLNTIWGISFKTADVYCTGCINLHNIWHFLEYLKQHLCSWCNAEKWS